MTRPELICADVAIAKVAVYMLVVLLALNVVVPLAVRWLGVTP